MSIMSLHSLALPNLSAATLMPCLFQLLVICCYEIIQQTFYKWPSIWSYFWSVYCSQITANSVYLVFKNQQQVHSLLTLIRELHQLHLLWTFRHKNDVFQTDKSGEKQLCLTSVSVSAAVHSREIRQHTYLFSLSVLNRRPVSPKKIYNNWTKTLWNVSDTT